MANQISFTYEGARYTLAFTRKTVQTLTRNGFSPDMVTEKPAIGIPMLFKGAFLANHRNIRDELTDKIFEKLENKTELIGKLLELYAEPINTLIADPDDNDEKKVAWEVV